MPPSCTHVPEAQPVTVTVKLPVVSQPVTLFALQSCCPGAHTPWHDAVVPFCTQVWLESEHGSEATMLPAELHPKTVFELQLCCPGAHEPWQTAPPPVKTHVWLVHAVDRTKLPVASHVQASLPAHRA